MLCHTPWCLEFESILLVQALLLQGMQGRWIMRGKVPTDDRLGNRRTYPQKSLRRGFVLAGMSLCDVHAAKFRVHVHATNKAGAQHNHRRWRCRACNEAYTCEHGFIKSNCLQCEAIKSGVQAQVAGGLGAAALAPSARCGSCATCTQLIRFGGSKLRNVGLCEAVLLQLGADPCAKRQALWHSGPNSEIRPASTCLQ